ncbi:MAG: sulfatase-like hydrolase/transferase [Verrucomicrobiota bacterium]
MKLSAFILLLCALCTSLHAAKPHIVLVMADDMGWGQTSYNNHPLLKTPNLDAMAANGLRFDRFYAASAVCSPTRAAVFTGRSPQRTGVPSHGHALRHQEKTLPAALKKAGYATGHFGKWHLNGIRGPGVPVLASDKYHPGVFGFEEWLTVTNFFDMNPVMSRKGEFEEFEGDSSEIIVDEALEFISEQVKAGKPTFSVIWYGTPHVPFMAMEKDRKGFEHLETQSMDHYAELVAMDRSIGTLRQGLKDMGIANDTLFWFTSDNGGLPKIEPETVGGLRGNKGNLYEGGIRVPTIIEYPAAIEPRITSFPASAMDIFPTIAELVGLSEDSMLDLVDGKSIEPLFKKELGKREKPIPFRYNRTGALVDNNLKLYVPKEGIEKAEAYDLSKDPTESNDITESRPKVAERLRKLYMAYSDSVDASIEGKDYPEGKVVPADVEPRFWTDMKEYEPYFDQWKLRPEYESRFKPKSKSRSAKK